MAEKKTAPAIVVGLGEHGGFSGKVVEAFTLIDDPNWNKAGVKWVDHTLHVYHTFQEAVEDSDKRLKKFEMELMELCGYIPGNETTPPTGDYKTYQSLWSQVRHLTDIAQGMGAYEAIHDNRTRL